MTSPAPTVALAFDTSDGVRLAARRWPAEGMARASVVVVHGFAGASDEPRVVALAEALHDAGYAVVAYDARGHGNSGGKATIGDSERFDVAAAVEALDDDKAPVVLIGASIGAIAVLHYAADAERPLAGVVTVSCPSRWRLPLNARGILSAMVTQTPFGRWAARTYMHVRIARGGRRPAPPVELIARVRAPVAIVHGRKDPFISPRDAEELFAAAREPRYLNIVDGMGHGFEPDAVAAVLAAVDWALRVRAG